MELFIALVILSVLGVAAVIYIAITYREAHRMEQKAKAAERYIDRKLGKDNTDDVWSA